MSAEHSAEKVVLARKSHEHLIRTRDRALREAEWAREQVASTERWAHAAFDEQRRLQDRLTAVVAAAAAQGVTIDAINEALGTTKGVVHEPRCNSECRPNWHHLTSGIGYPHLHTTDLAGECGECVNRPGQAGS